MATVKQLYLIRHAKSSWDNPALDDFDRPLNARGLRDAPAAGQRLADAGARPDLIVSSPAARAIATARTIAGAVGYEPDQIAEAPEIYEADPDALLDVIRGLEQAHQKVFLFGHNPGFTALACMLGDREIDNLPTCGVYAVAFDASGWREIGPSSGVCTLVDYPKKHKKK